MTDSILFAADGPASELLSIVQEGGIHELLDMYPACELPDDAALDTLATLLGCATQDEAPTEDEGAGEDEGPWVVPASERDGAIVRALDGKDLEDLAVRWREAHLANVASSERKEWKDPSMLHQLRATLEELAQVGGAMALGRSLFMAMEL
ncbi:hypothetical protein LZC95_51665 [Pendulispora brunnea]|uniref:Uncharacterized protein n=1 Tax=Pendulispora brunnea TaxID=2905690 RepID=A0ABZ2KDC7_9BACT